MVEGAQRRALFPRLDGEDSGVSCVVPECVEGSAISWCVALACVEGLAIRRHIQLNLHSQMVPIIGHFLLDSRIVMPYNYYTRNS